MSYKVNLANPGRREAILAKRKKYGPGLPATLQYKGRYIPGNGPNHKLGRAT